MLFSTSNKFGYFACAFVSAVAISNASAGYAQSTSSVGSDSDYLVALTTMSADMDLNGLASQTHEPTTVTVPQLPAVASSAAIVFCETLQLQAEDSGHRIEMFGDDSALSDSELAALSKCMDQDSGLVVSYLMPTS